MRDSSSGLRWTASSANSPVACGHWTIFARAFFGVNDRDWGELTYTFEDVVRTLNQVQPHDWGTLLRDRVEPNTAAFQSASDIRLTPGTSNS